MSECLSLTLSSLGNNVVRSHGHGKGTPAYLSAVIELYSTSCYDLLYTADTLRGMGQKKILYAYIGITLPVNWYARDHVCV